jgi:hydroxymethylglutaryl-CoA synthase
MEVGIDAIQFDIPKLYLSIQELAENRNIEADKLTKGLGLQKMSFLDVQQDVITMGANALLKLIEQESINPSKIAKIYVGTESGIDNSKPIASYLISLIEQKLGANVFQNCDVVDLTFACIGAVDALQSCVDYIRLNPSKKAIVIATDFAKYDLNSTGEYTQGAGAIAMLVTSNPRIIAFSNETGVATSGVFDFFKPKQTIQKAAITGTKENENWFGVLETEVTIVKDQPVFDGQYKNNWDFIFMHLPYCFQGRRTFIELFANENQHLVAAQEGDTLKDKIKALSKSKEYICLVNDKIYPSEIASGEVGNIYTGSIFLGMLSALYFAGTENKPLSTEKVGFIAYGSGSKSKVFEGRIQSLWKEQILKTNLFEMLASRTSIDFLTYEKLHKKELKTSILQSKNEFILDKIETENPVLKGARFYTFIE